MKNETTRKIALSGLFIAMGLVLPFLTGSIPRFGRMMLPMHIPVLLCGFICGEKYGAMTGFVVPLLRSALWHAPVFPISAIAMAFELMTYGFVSGFLYRRSKWQCIVALYRCLIAAMAAGRLVFGPVKYLLTLLLGNGETYSFALFWSEAFASAVPGIIIQLTLIPALMLALDKTGLVRFRNFSAAEKNA